MQRALSRLKARRLKGSTLTLQDLLVRAELVSPEDIAAILEPPRRGRRAARRQWNDYDEKRSGRFSEILERRRERASEDDDPAEPRRRKTKKRRKATVVGGFLIEDSEVAEAPAKKPPAKVIDDDEQTATIDSRAAALEALRRLDKPIKAGAQESEGEADNESRSLPSLLRDRRVLAAAVVILALGLAASTLFEGEGPSSVPPPDIGSAPASRDPAEEKRLRAGLARARRARALEQDGDFAAALSAWAEVTEAPDKAAAIARLEAARAYEDRVAEALKRAGEGSEKALASFGALLNETSGQGSAAAYRVLDRLTLLLENAARSGVFVKESAPSNPALAQAPPEPAARLRAFEALRREGAERVARLSQILESEARELEDRRGRARERLVKAFEGRVLDLSLRGGGQLRERRLLAADEGGLELEGAKGRARVSWWALSPEDAWRLRRAGAGSGPWERWDLACFALSLGLEREASAAFREAGSEPDLKARIPELALATPRPRGRLLSLGGGLISLAYGPEWPVLEAPELIIEDGALSFGGAGFRRVGFEDLLFGDGVNLRLRGVSASGSALAGLGLVDEAGAGFAVAVQPSSGLVVSLRLERGGSERRGRPRRLGSALKSLGLSLSQGRWRAEVNGAEAFTEASSGPGPWRPVLLALGRGSPRFAELRLAGRLSDRGLGSRLQRREAERRAWLRGLDDRPRLLPRGRSPSAAAARRAGLSAEDAFGLRALGELEPRYRRACEAVASEDFAVVLGGMAELRRLGGAVPSLAGGLFRLARAHRRLGQRQRALVLLGRAASLCPRFYEALSLRAALLLELGYRGAARREAKRALALRPDDARALRCLGQVEARRDPAAGRRLLELASALDPWDERTREARRFLDRRLAAPASWSAKEVGGERFELSGEAASLETVAAVRRGVAELLDLRPAEAAPRIRVLPDASALAAYARVGFTEPSASAEAVFAPELAELVLVRGAAGVSVVRAAARQRLWEAMPLAPSWLVAAVLERASSWRLAGGQVAGEDGVAERARRLRAALEARGGAWPLGSLMARRGALDGAAALQSWSLLRFLTEGGESRAWAQYIGALKRGVGAREAYARAFGAREAELTEAWRAALRLW